MSCYRTHPKDKPIMLRLILYSTEFAGLNNLEPYDLYSSTAYHPICIKSILIPS